LSVPKRELLYARGRNLKIARENRNFMMTHSVMNGISTIRAVLFARMAWLLVSLWSRTINIRIVNRDIAERLAAQGKNVIYAFYHGSLFPLIHSHRGSRVLILVSESRDGEIMARLLQHNGFDVVRGSSRRRGQKALLSLVHGMRRGKSVAVAVDGPRGPLQEVKEGVLFLAGITQAPVIPVATAAKRFRTAEKSWDKLMLPAPFTDGLVLYGEPLQISGTSREEIQAGRMRLEAELRRLSREAVLRLGTSPEGRPSDPYRNANY
jgi:lysophospholipid acyltransferase (LPLAT)-like uncharacterized protein